MSKLFKISERNQEIREIYSKAPDHLKGKAVLDIQRKTELSRAAVYNIVKKSTSKK